jgi:hypothetical protein
VAETHNTSGRFLIEARILQSVTNDRSPGGGSPCRFSISGTPEEARQRLSEYSDFPHLVLHTPYIPPLSAEESDDAYRQIIDAFGELARNGTATSPPTSVHSPLDPAGSPGNI